MAPIYFLKGIYTSIYIYIYISRGIKGTRYIIPQRGYIEVRCPIPFYLLSASRYTINPKPQTLSPKPATLNRKPCPACLKRILNPKP